MSVSKLLQPLCAKFCERSKPAVILQFVVQHEVFVVFVSVLQYNAPDIISSEKCMNKIAVSSGDGALEFKADMNDTNQYYRRTSL